jgi:2-amino-4-hydroxy-6-hydroxymethyldihydropteridine diphosphokinase
MPQAYIGIGANLGNAKAAVHLAIAAIANLPHTVLLAQSSLYASAPVDSHGDDYINAVVSVSTTLSAHELLAQLQAIEQAAGRERPYKNAPRTLDLDVLLCGSERINTPELTVPHPRLHERAFVLLPLAEISPDLTLEGYGALTALLQNVANQRVIKLTLLQS